MQIGVIGSSKTLTGSRLATTTILVNSVIWLAGKSQKCHPPDIQVQIFPNNCISLFFELIQILMHAPLWISRASSTIIRVFGVLPGVFELQFTQQTVAWVGGTFP